MEAPDHLGALQIKFVDETIAYTGEQLHSLWAYRAFGLEGDSAVAFCGACDVRPEHMRDLEDLKAGSRIVSENMLHFIIEHSGCDLQSTALRQWVFMARMSEALNGLLREPRIRRAGSDLYDGERKVTVSIASVSPVSGLIHAGINISSRNTPVPARGLEDYGISARDFGQRMLEGYAQECAGITHACGKVRACP